MFSKQYICLVAGLREYSLDADAKGLDLEALLSQVYEELSGSDQVAVKLLYGYYDCENLAAAYAGRANHNPLGRISAEGIASIIRSEHSVDLDPADLFPSEVVEVIESYLSKGVDSSKDNFERALFAAYYDACSASKSRFLREWSASDQTLRNVAAAITARVMQSPIEEVLVGSGSVVDQLKRSSAVDFGLRGEFSHIESVIGAVSDEPNIVEKERRIDLVRWAIVEELVEGEYFSLDFVLGYLVKVNIVSRWLRLDATRGAEMFAKLMEQLSGKGLINNKQI